MSINPKENVNNIFSSENKSLFSEKERNLQRLNRVVDEVSSAIIGRHQNVVLDEDIQEINNQLFQKLSKEELLEILEEKEKQLMSTSLQSINFLLDRIESNEKKEISEMQKKGIRFQDIDRALLNATKQLEEVKNILFPELKIKSEKEKNKLEDFLIREQKELLSIEDKLEKSFRSIGLVLDHLEQGQQVTFDSSFDNRVDLEKIFIEKEEKVKSAKKVTEDLVNSLKKIKDNVSFSEEEEEVFISKLFQLKDSANQCVLSFSQLTTFSEACSFFLKNSKELITEKREKKSSFEESKVCCKRIKEIFHLVQKKLRNFGLFVKSLFVRLFSFLASSCTSACMSSLIMLRRGKRRKDLKFVEDLFIEGKLSFGSSSIEILSNLKLFLKLFGLDLLIHREKEDLDYRVVINISDQALSNTESLSSIMLSLVKYFENFSFEEVLLEIDGFSDDKAEELEEILESKLEDLFLYSSWIFFENMGFLNEEVQRKNI